MIDVDLQQLVKALDAPTRNELEGPQGVACPEAVARFSLRMCCLACWNDRMEC